MTPFAMSGRVARVIHGRYADICYGGFDRPVAVHPTRPLAWRCRRRDGLSVPLTPVLALGGLAARVMQFHPKRVHCVKGLEDGPVHLVSPPPLLHALLEPSEVAELPADLVLQLPALLGRKVIHIHSRRAT